MFCGLKLRSEGSLQVGVKLCRCQVGWLLLRSLTIDAIWLILARQTRWVSAGTIVPAGQIPLGANSGIRWVISRVRCGAMQSMASASYADDQARSSEGEKSEPQARRLLTSVGDPGLFKALRPSPRGVCF